MLQTLSDKDTIEVFNFVAARETSSVKLRGMKKDLSEKQYYARTRSLLNLGLVKRKGGRLFAVTAFGKAVNKVLLDLDMILENVAKFKAVDTILSSEELDKDQKIELAKIILTETKLERVLPKIQ